MAIPLFHDEPGYDPYNHTGRLVRRTQAWYAMRQRLLDELFMPPRWLGMDFGREPSRTVYHFPPGTVLWNGDSVTFTVDEVT